MPTNNLPVQATTFVGREQERSDIALLLADPNCRLLTIVGVGGIGKTRLGIQAAMDQQTNFADGTVFVSLAPVNSPDLIPAAIAGALNISFFGSEEPRLQLMNYLNEKHTLLVMDNFEHLLERVNLLSELLQSAPNLKILVTSRIRLNLQEEWVFTLDGLSYPTETLTSPLEDFDAVQLFTQRARQTNHQFTLTENASAVQIICQQVEGMPLGLELAATWLRAMSCQQIVEQMTHNLDFLTTPLRNVPERHRSLRVVLEQSWRFMSLDEQAVLMKLSVFRGSFDLEAAAYVAGASSSILAHLVDQSLIRLNNMGRYDIHELLRQYADEQLSSTDMAASTVQKHIDYFLNLAQQAESHQFGREKIYWFDRLEVEMDNLRTALARTVESETGLQLVTTLGWFFSERAYRTEGLGWLVQGLKLNPNAPAFLRAKALNHAGAYAGHNRDFEQLKAYCSKALDIAQTNNDDWNIAWALSHLGSYNNRHHELDHSTALLEKSVKLFRNLSDPLGLAFTIVRLSWNTNDQNNIPYTRTLLNEAASLASVAGDAFIAGWVTMTIGDIARYQHDFEQARIEYEASLLYCQQAKFREGIYHALVNLAQAAIGTGSLHRAKHHLKEALTLKKDALRDNAYLSSIFSLLAKIARKNQEFERAARLLATAHEEHLVYWSQQLPDKYTYLSDITAVREQMGNEAFVAEWVIGKAMTWKQAIDYALEDDNKSANVPIVAPSNFTLLTTREIEILRLMSDGLNSREIANRLILSAETIRWYLKQIYSKLDVHSRSEAIAQAKQLNLLL